MQPASSFAILCLTIVLHAALVGTLIYRFDHRPVKLHEPASITVQLISPPSSPPQLQPPLPPVVEKAPARSTPRTRLHKSVQKSPVPTIKTAPKSVASQKESKVETEARPAPVTAASTDTASSVPAPVPAPNPPAAPAKTHVFVNPSYVATETGKWYPRLARQYGDEGAVLLRVTVSPSGRAEKVELKRSSRNSLLDEAAIGLAKSLTYKPATLDGTPTTDTIDLPIVFKLTD